MHRRAFIVAVPALFVVGCAGTAKEPSAALDGPRFSDAERKFITEYFANERAKQPAKPTPPQQAKAGDKLPPGARPTHLPNAVKDKLGPLPAPYTRLVLGADVILVNRDTHDIVDVIPQVVY
jgi:hypothetical protein